MLKRHKIHLDIYVSERRFSGKEIPRRKKATPLVAALALKLGLVQQRTYCDSLYVLSMVVSGNSENYHLFRVHFCELYSFHDVNDVSVAF